MKRLSEPFPLLGEAMPYNVPDFNLLAAFWLPTSNALTDPPDFPNVPVQLYRSSRAQTSSQVQIRIPESYSTIPMPGDSGVTVDLICECPFGAGAYYRVDHGLWMHRGLPNEYILALSNPVVRNALNTQWIFSDSDTDLV